jgi:hypothetical protein
MHISPFLRSILKLDAATCLAMAALLAPGASTLSPLLGIPSAILAGAGLSLVPIGLFMLWLGTRDRAPAIFAHLVIAGNLAWTCASFILVAALQSITAAGTTLVIAQALAVAVFALLEWRGLRQSVAGAGQR